MMTSPAHALLWEAWRLTRARFLTAVLLATIGGAALLAAAGDRASAAAVIVPILVTTIAVISVLDLPLTKLGFPFSASFTRPVATSVLVVTPMLYAAVLGAALYLVPVAVLRVAFDIPFPLATVPAWIGAGVLAQTAASWGTKGGTVRLVARIVALFAVLQLAVRLNPSSPFPRDILAARESGALSFSAAEAAVLVLLGAAAIGWAVASVRRQRHARDGGALPSAANGAGPLDTATAERRTPGRDRAAPLAGMLRCPTRSPMLAELWLETRHRGLVVLGATLPIAAAIPPFLAIGNAYGWRFPLFFAFGSFFVPLFAGLGVVRTGRAASPGGMTAFEASRPISTARLAAVRVAVPALSMLAGWMMIACALRLGLPLFDDVWDSTALRQSIGAGLSAASPLRLAGWTIVAAVVYASVVATLSALNAFFVLYRRRLTGALLLSFGYAIVLLGAAVTGAIGFGAVVWHVWALAAAVGASTVVVVARAVGARVLDWSHIGVAMLVWAVYAVVWAALTGDGVAQSGPLSVAAPAAVAVALMPLLSFALAPWSLFQLRHS